MPSPSVLPVFVATALALLVIPGPAVLYITARAATQGRRAGVISMLGVHTGSVVHVVAAVVGLSAVLVASAAAFTTVKLVGALYLVYLGVRTILGRREVAGTELTRSSTARRLYVDGIVVNVLNPKTALFFLAFLPQFVDPERPLWSQTLVLGLVFIMLGIASDGAYALAGAHVGRRLLGAARSSGRTGRFVEGGLLVGLGVASLALPHQRGD